MNTMSQVAENKTLIVTPPPCHKGPIIIIMTPPKSHYIYIIINVLSLYDSENPHARECKKSGDIPCFQTSPLYHRNRQICQGERLNLWTKNPTVGFLYLFLNKQLTGGGKLKWCPSCVHEGQKVTLAFPVIFDTKMCIFRRLGGKFGRLR